MATINNQSPDEYRRREIALELMEAYVCLTCCCIFFLFSVIFSRLHFFRLFFFIHGLFSWLHCKILKKPFMVSFLHFVFRDCE